MGDFNAASLKLSFFEYQKRMFMARLDSDFATCSFTRLIWLFPQFMLWYVYGPIDVNE